MHVLGHLALFNVSERRGRTGARDCNSHDRAHVDDCQISPVPQKDASLPGPGAGSRSQADSASCTTAPSLRTGVTFARGSLDLAFTNLPEVSVGKDGVCLHAFPGAAWVRIPGRRSGPDRYGRVTATPFIVFQAYASIAVRR